MDCDELIDRLLSGSGEQLRNNEGTTGDSLVSPDACSGETTGQHRLIRNDEVTGQKAVQDRVQNYRERLASVSARGEGGGVKAGRYGLLAHGKSINRHHIEELDDSEMERLYARYEARLGAAMTKTLGSAALQLYAGWYLCFSQSRPKTNQGLLLTSRATRLTGTHLAVPPASYTVVMACS